MEKIMTETKKRDATKKYVQFSQAGGATQMNRQLVEVATLADAEAPMPNPIFLILFGNKCRIFECSGGTILLDC